jgi:hypothetical protein
VFSSLQADRGSAFIAAGIMAASFVLLGAVVVEVGQWLSHRRHVQVRADAAALSGGQLLAECFNVPQFISESTADSSIENAARDYGGLTSNKNIQPLDQGTGEQSLMSFQHNSYPDQVAGGDLGPECYKSDGTPNLMLDVKMAETGIPRFFGFSPLETVHGWARVQLQQIRSLTPALPFAIPDVRVQVAVTFVNSAGAPLPGCSNGCVFKLGGPTQSGGLNVYGANATIPLPPANSNVGMRVALGTNPGSCAVGVTPTGYTCFDDGSNNGLIALRSYNSTTAGSQSAPILRAVTPTTCSGTPFFSDFQATGGTCSYGVTATVDWGNSGPPANAHVRATVNGTNLTLARSGTTNTWISTNTVTLATLQGAKPVTMSWCVGTCNNNNSFTAFAGNPVQQIFSGSDSPILAASVLDQNTGSAFYSFPQNSSGNATANLAVTVGLSNGVHLPTRCSNGTSGATYSCPTDPAVFLRNVVANGNNDSLTLTINCGHSTIQDDIQFGCTQPYSLNTADICPDVGTPPNPPDCALTRQGGKVGPLEAAMSARFAPGGGCDPNNYPNYQPGGLDPRAVTLIITDWNAFDTSGKTTVPVVTFATFYVTGWDGAPSSCNGVNQPAPPGDDKKADIWGHYIADVNIGAIPNGTVCVGPGQQPGVVPCAIALVR